MILEFEGKLGIRLPPFVMIVQPIKVNYRGYDVWEIPTNVHGLVALSALNILKGFEFSGKEDVETYHKQWEAIKLAFADGCNTLPIL